MSMLASLFLWTAAFAVCGTASWVWQHHIRPPIDPSEVIPTQAYFWSWLVCITIYVILAFTGPYPGH
ncbi:hypothetical protein [Paenalcaligenes suwonensis]|uniref:hypothetical protein n=1 Tax=Paenalcaligenes suwonensis TaxID=1202713 RepID=UPI00140A5FFF|nr:hypothetical protein [Paenalcaligenes suwonensis]NHC62748.1 hypothetical protein [Paenalcaligenes suwonensis]